ncbi:MAG: hypothetical protein ISR78_08405 [Spirochaetia bacterium]|nr:hypothetical protein [Spirochaetia bacterium]
MNDKLRIEEIKELFMGNKFTNEQLYQLYLSEEPGLKENTFRWRVYKLKAEGVIQSVERGVYTTRFKKVFNPQISNLLQEYYRRISAQFPYMNFSIWHTSWLHTYMNHQPLTDNTIIEVEKEAMVSVFTELYESYNNVFLNPEEKEIERYIETGQKNIIVKNLIKESPLKTRDGIIIPKIEKILIDLYVDRKLYRPYQGNELRNIYENLFSMFNINQSTLSRYANRRGAREKLYHFLFNDLLVEF